jgi:hypothetical protein
MDALEGLENGTSASAERFVTVFATSDSFLVLHMKARLMMLQNDYRQSQKLLLQMLNDTNATLKKLELYLVLCELEVCCREIEDFKDAYKYANEKVELLEQLLKEI